MTSVSKKENNLYRLYQDLETRPALKEEVQKLNSKIDRVSSSLRIALQDTSASTSFTHLLMHNPASSRHFRSFEQKFNTLNADAKECNSAYIEQFATNLSYIFGKDKVAGIQQFVERDVLNGSVILGKIEKDTWE